MLPSPRSMPALITPFDRAGEIDLSAHRHNLGILSEKGVRGFLLAGSTGEGPYLEPGERYPLVHAARKTLGRRTHLICGVTAETTRLGLRLIAEAADGGADAVLVMTPTTLVRSRIQYVESFYVALADAATALEGCRAKADPTRVAPRRGEAVDGERLQPATPHTR